MAIVKWDPFRDMITMKDRMDRLFEDSLNRFRGEAEDMAHSTWSPAVDIYETADDIIIKAEIPGVNKKDISVEVKDNSLYLKGERKFKKEVKEENYHRMERSYGSFCRIFSLPTSVKQDEIKAKFKNGVLQISIPKVEEETEKSVNIDVE